MSNLTRRPRIALAGAIALALIIPAMAVAAIDWQITLAGSNAYPGASGGAQYQSQQGHREVQVEVQHVRALAGRTVTFSAGGMMLGRATVSRAGQADVTRNTELRQAVPAITHGSTVSVRTTRGRLIASGRF
jgi:hypothetical protein